MNRLWHPLALTALVASCGTWIGNPKPPGGGDTPPGGASAKIALQNDTAPGALLHALTSKRAPTIYGMKVVRVYVAEDVDPVTGSNVGETSLAYLHPTCADEQGSCDVSGADQNVTTYLDMLRPTAAVNADLNAQQRTIKAGTYRYARIELAGANPDNAPTIRWAADGVPVREFVFGGTGTTKLAAPITVADGDTVVFTLAYDLAEIVNTVANKPEGFDCAPADGGQFHCMYPPEFKANAALQPQP